MDNVSCFYLFLSHHSERIIGETSKKQDSANENGISCLILLKGTLSHSCVKVGRIQVLNSYFRRKITSMWFSFLCLNVYLICEKEKDFLLELCYSSFILHKIMGVWLFFVVCIDSLLLGGNVILFYMKKKIGCRKKV